MFRQAMRLVAQQIGEDVRNETCRTKIRDACREDLRVRLRNPRPLLDNYDRLMTIPVQPLRNTPKAQKSL
jgi:hypothetical protein